MYLDKISEVVENINKSHVKKIGDMIINCHMAGGKIVLAGNGGSSSIASHMAQDLIKCNKIPAICLTDNIPSVTAYSNDIDYNLALLEIAKVLYDENDLLILFSTSGNSKNIINLVNSYLGENIVAVLGNEGGDLRNSNAGIEYIITEGFDPRSNEDVFSIVCHAVIEYITQKQGGTIP